jgi:epoxyqueuosine reductase
MATLAEMIKETAKELGFCKVGIARAEPLESERLRFADWLRRGFHGEMAWMARDPDKRSDPTKISPAAVSVIVLALNYYTQHEHAEEPELGKISRYAWGDDYHDVMREKMTALLQFIKTESPDADGKICVDTAPMMDKAWAVKAGLGWAGKNSNVITTDHGSWIFIGEILLNLDLEPDRVMVEDHCGSCTACLDACPTGAIVEPYVVDSRKCISYGTIELRSEELPNEIADSLEGWLYGCDVCQDVCPWNRFGKPSPEPRFQPRHSQTSLDLKETERMDHDIYVERFRKSAIKRAKLAGLQRNARALRKRRV